MSPYVVFFMWRIVIMMSISKWTAPLVALALVLSFNAWAGAQESKETGSMSGTVVDKDGKPVEGANVRLMKPMQRGRGPADKQAAQGASALQLAEKPAKPGKPDKGEPGKPGNRPKPVATATTDADGKFTMEDVAAGEYMVVAMVRGQGAARQPVTVKAGETATVELKLQDRPAGGPGGPGGPGGRGPGQRPGGGGGASE